MVKSFMAGFVFPVAATPARVVPPDFFWLGLRELQAWDVCSVLVILPRFFHLYSILSLINIFCREYNISLFSVYCANFAHMEADMQK